MKLKVLITFTEELLGTKAANPEVFATFIASKAPDGDKRREEIATAEAREESGTSVFHRQKDIPGVWDYQVKGFFKDACQSLRGADDTLSSSLTAYKTKIDGLIFVTPRFIPIQIPDGLKVGLCERPLRADTAQGPRVSVCRSETAPKGSKITIEIVSLAEKIGKGDNAVEVRALMEEWLNYGLLRGMGQWRNSGKGRFTWSEIA